MAARDLANYTIVIANPSQEEQHARAAFVPWSRGSTWEEFVAAGQKESGATWARHGRMKVWVLVKRNDPDGEIFAGCETYRRDAIIKRKGIDVLDETIVYGIASVVTPVKHLRNGFATHLLRLLHWHLASRASFGEFPKSWGASPPDLSSPNSIDLPKADASILWSDVGSKFYEKCTIGQSSPGWIVDDTENIEISWDILPPSDDDGSEWEWIYESDLNEVAQIMLKTTEKRLMASTGSTVYAQKPTSEGTLGFIPIRSSYGPQPPHRDMDQPEPFGVRLKTNPSSVVLFAPYHTSLGPRLHIMALHDIQPSHIPSLLRCLDSVAAKAKLDRGWVWGLGSEGEIANAFSNAEGRNVQIGKRPEKMGHLLGVAWYGPPNERGKLLDCQMWSWC